MTGSTELKGLISTVNFGAYSAFPSPIIKKVLDVKDLNSLNWIGTSSEPEITVQAMESRELKENKDFVGIQGDGLKFAARKSSGMLF